MSSGDGVGRGTIPDGTLLPGRPVELAGGGERTIRSVFLCSERIGERVTQWRWAFLDDGSLLEIAPRGWAWYRTHLQVEQGSDRHDRIVGPRGALARFEARVRSGESGRRPVFLSLDRRRYRVAFTGTVSALRLGPEPELASWRSFADDPSQNVYFGLIRGRDGQERALGLWTSDVCLSFGEALSDKVEREGE